MSPAIGRRLGIGLDRLVVQMLLLFFAVVCLLMAVCTAMLAVWLRLLPHLGATFATLVVAGLFLVIAALLGLAVILLRRRWQHQAALAAAYRDRTTSLQSMSLQSLFPLLLGVVAMGFSAGRHEK